MKVLMVNGSPNANGCTNRALKEVADTLAKEGIESEIVQIGKKPIAGCIGCGACFKVGDGKCAAFRDDAVNVIQEKMKEADGLVVGSPVYFLSPNGSLISLMDRMFMCGQDYAYKPAACVTSARRGGTSATVEVMNKYFLMSNMPVVPTNHVPTVHGHEAAEVEQDLEGLQSMRVLARNMAWMIKSIKTANLPKPEAEAKVKTSYIR